MAQISYFTDEGLQKLKDELHQLKVYERTSISKQIAEARDKGDLSENAEYDAAKEAQGLLELRISKLEAVLMNALVVPKIEIDYIFDIEDSDLAAMMVFAKKVAIALKVAVPCKRIGVAVIGLEVPHTHIHLVPMNTMDDLNFTRPKLKPSQEELKLMATKICSKF